MSDLPTQSPRKIRLPARSTRTAPGNVNAEETKRGMCCVTQRSVNKGLKQNRDRVRNGSKVADTNQDEVCTVFSLYLYDGDDEVLRFHGAENSEIYKSENFLIFRPCFLKDIDRSADSFRCLF